MLFEAPAVCVRSRDVISSAKMTEPLVTYLHDHLAGSKLAIDLLRSLRDHHSCAEFSAEVAATLLLEIEKDRATLERIISRVGKGSPDLKEAAAWFTEKVSRFKLSHADAKGLGTLQALETLSLGILGK